MGHKHSLKWSIERVIYCEDAGCDFCIDATQILKIVKDNAAEQSFAPDGLTPRQKDEVLQIANKAIRNAFNEFARR